MNGRLSILYPVFFCNVRWSRESITSELHVFFSSSESNRNVDDKQGTKRNMRVCVFVRFLYSCFSQTDWYIFVLCSTLNRFACASVHWCLYVFVCLFFRLNQVTWRWHFDWLFFIYIGVVMLAVILFSYAGVTVVIGVDCFWPDFV